MEFEAEPIVVREPRWTFWDSILALLAGLAGAIIGAVGVFAFTGEEELTLAQEFGVLATAQSLATLVAVWLIVTRKGTGDVLGDLGIGFVRFDWVGVPVGLGLQIAFIVVVAPILDALGVDESTQEIARRTQEADDPAVLVLAFLVIVLLAPFTEEVLFRGLMLRALLRRFTRWPAILISSAVFGLVHLLGVSDPLDPGAWVVVGALVGVGIALAWPAVRRGSLGFSIAMHSGFNLFAFVALAIGEPEAEPAEGLLRLLL